jgi:hypothetical protein
MRSKEKERVNMRLAKLSLVGLMMVAFLFVCTGCTADDGWQKGLADGISGGVAFVIQTAIETIFGTILPAA